MREAVQNRMSYRVFDREYLAEEERDKITDLLEQINDESGLNAVFLENGAKSFECYKPDEGKFKNVHSLILMKGEIFLSNLREKVGYYGEQLILDLEDMGIATCWVTGHFNKKGHIEVPSSEVLICLILVGKVYRVNAKDKLRHAVAAKAHKPVSRRLDSTVKPEDWVLDGMEAVHLAPSYKDTQKPMFHYNGETVTADVPNKSKLDMVDLGIAKKHFETGTPGRFDFGNGAAFHQE